MSYSAKAVANYFIALAKKRGEKLTPMKLQKLVYFAHGWHLALTEHPLIDEKVEAWQYGPVIPSLYHEFKSYGKGSISEPATDLDDSLNFVVPELPVDSPADLYAKALIEKVFDVYGKYSGIQLSNLTHIKGSPWEQTWQPNLPKGTDIDESIIKSYFLKSAKT